METLRWLKMPLFLCLSYIRGTGVNLKLIVSNMCMCVKKKKKTRKFCFHCSTVMNNFAGTIFQLYANIM